MLFDAVLVVVVVVSFVAFVVVVVAVGVAVDGECVVDVFGRNLQLRLDSRP